MKAWFNVLSLDRAVAQLATGTLPERAAAITFDDGYADNATVALHQLRNRGLTATFFIEELKVDINMRDADGFTALHHAAARGDNEMIKYLVSKGANVMAVNRAGQTTVDMANSPEQRTQPFPETIKLLEGMGAKNNHNCRACGN